LFRCDVRIQRTWPGGPGISGWPGHHKRNCQSVYHQDRLCGRAVNDRSCPGGAEMSSTMYRTHRHLTEGMRSSGENYFITEGVCRPQVTTTHTPLCGTIVSLRTG
jgi:hypothetical protein